MTNHREIPRLATMGMNRTSIGAALGCSRNTVAETLARANRKNISYPLPMDMSDIELETLLFPENAAKNQRRLPDCELLHKELSKPGVTLTLLWDEYCARCRQDGDLPYAYTQFRHHYHLHGKVQENPQDKRSARKAQRAFFTTYKCQPYDCERCGRNHSGRATWTRPAKHHTGYLQPCV